MISSTSLAYRWSSCEITCQNLMRSLLMPTKVNCTSAWTNHTDVRSVQKDGSHTAILDTAACELCRVRAESGSPMWDVDGLIDNHVKICGP
jgi:hypothetical protein